MEKCAGSVTLLESSRDAFVIKIQETLEIGQEKAERIYEELLECTRHNHMVIIQINFS